MSNKRKERGAYLELRGADHTPAVGVLALLERLPQSLSTPNHVPTGKVPGTIQSISQGKRACWAESAWGWYGLARHYGITLFREALPRALSLLGCCTFTASAYIYIVL